MAGQRQPIALLKARGSKHLTKKEIEEREAQEIHVPFTNIHIPDYLAEDMHEDFTEISGKLVEIGIMTELDEDALARYLMSRKLYIRYSRMLTQLLDEAAETKSVESMMILQDKAFKQCRSSAGDLGLTISSRCRLVMPKAEETKKNKFSRFEK